MAVDQWAIRIAAARDAQSRTRVAFLASTVIAFALLIAVFNFETSWLRNFADPEVAKEAIGPLQEEIQRELRKSWVDSARLKITALGVDIGGSDATVMGSLGIYILTTWFFYCMRRENHLLVRLMADAVENHDHDIKLSVYHGINSYTIFTVIGDDKPINTLKPPPRSEIPLAHNRPIFGVLAFLPVLTITFMIATDVWSLFRPAIVRNPNKLLYDLLTRWELWEVAAIEAIATLVLIRIVMTCYKILSCEKATEEVLQQFHMSLFPQQEKVISSVKSG